MDFWFQIVLTEMYSDGFHRSFCDDDEDLDVIQESDSIFAFETPELFRPEQIRSKRCGTTSRLLPRNEITANLMSARVQLCLEIGQNMLG